ncbi:GNAT family N-acetyltransferase [Salinarimonas soli]|uniref:GNAT family N-acetyltransferase n=1 Tax=Salinarimonas soli TaxID=1638099 RepID=A0A5B2V7H6_9HYPH|nr:GNAT family N-acetyltransferase [Salinarimonas soli]KAA2234382.1 GNAT family N-acetyltransferase [Salinarimonas soli]
MGLSLRTADDGDLDCLAEMNLGLIRDSGHRSRMTLAVLRERFVRSRAEGGSFDIFEDATGPVGFAGWREEDTQADPSGRHVFLRQFYMVPERRGDGTARACFDLLARERWHPGQRVALDVLDANRRGAPSGAAWASSPIPRRLRRTCNGAVAREARAPA